MTLIYNFPAPASTPRKRGRKKAKKEQEPTIIDELVDDGIVEEVSDTKEE